MPKLVKENKNLRKSGLSEPSFPPSTLLRPWYLSSSAYQGLLSASSSFLSRQKPSQESGSWMKRDDDNQLFFASFKVALMLYFTQGKAG